MEDILKELKNDQNFNYKQTNEILQDGKQKITYDKEETKKIERELRKLGYIK